MKFRYGYRTKDNEKVEGVISATSREDVYAQLRREGRKPYMVEPLPGFLNRLSGISKRWLAIGALGFICAALSVIILSTPTPPTYTSLDAALDAPTRRQPIGDAAIIDKGIREGWADVFTLEGDRFLASFAVPGTPPAIRSTTEEKLKEALSSDSSLIPHPSSLGSALLEARQIRAMVSGMKQELREFIAAGGTIKQYGKRLVQRQEAELGYYHRAKTELDRAIAEKRGEDAINALIEKHNAALRKIGVKLLVLPE